MKAIRNTKTNKVEFFNSKGKKVVPTSVRGNIATFKDGSIICF